MRLTKLIGTYLWTGKKHYEPEYGVDVQDVINKLGEIEDMGCMKCPPGNYIEIPFKEGTILYEIISFPTLTLYGCGSKAPSCYRITKKKATLDDCIRCKKDKSLGKTIFLNEDEAWAELKRIGRKEWYD